MIFWLRFCILIRIHTAYKDIFSYHEKYNISDLNIPNSPLCNKQFITARKNDYQNKESTIFLWFQLVNHVILRLPRKKQAKKQMINLCRQYYRGNY
jgi:hypothetical protein